MSWCRGAVLLVVVRNKSFGRTRSTAVVLNIKNFPQTREADAHLKTKSVLLFFLQVSFGFFSRLSMINRPTSTKNEHLSFLLLLIIGLLTEHAIILYDTLKYEFRQHHALTFRIECEI